MLVYILTWFSPNSLTHLRTKASITRKVASLENKKELILAYVEENKDAIYIMGHSTQADRAITGLNWDSIKSQLFWRLVVIRLYEMARDFLTTKLSP